MPGWRVVDIPNGIPPEELVLAFQCVHSVFKARYAEAAEESRQILQAVLA